MNKKTANKILSKVKQDYEKISDEFDLSRKYNWKEFDDFIKYINNGNKLIDLGCGNGRFWGYLRNVGNNKGVKDIQYVGVDNNEKLIKKACENYPEAKFIVGDMLDLPMKDNSIDSIVAIASLHHIPSNDLRKQAIKEMHRILKKNGVLIITVWNLFQPKYIKYIWKARIKSLLTLGKYGPRDTFIPWGKSGVDRYYYAFKKGDLTKLIYDKFELINIKKGNNLIFVCRK